jgi:hypothetical protein
MFGLHRRNDSRLHHCHLRGWLPHVQLLHVNLLCLQRYHDGRIRWQVPDVLWQHRGHLLGRDLCYWLPHVQLCDAVVLGVQRDYVRRLDRRGQLHRVHWEHHSGLHCGHVPRHRHCDWRNI